MYFKHLLRYPLGIYLSTLVGKYNLLEHLEYIIVNIIIASSHTNLSWLQT